jgi:glycosyltransferase involved in cell wall biosynthesis
MLISLLILCAIIVCTYWIGFYLAKRKFKTGHILDQIKGVSIIVCYKNESINIESTIKAILEQDYPLFEVVAIDDFSTDGGPKRLAQINDSRLILLKCDEDKPGKKFALNQAINRSNFDSLLFIDGDCVPASKTWIRQMLGSQVDDGCVLGYGPLNVNDNLLGWWQQYETCLTAMQYMSYALHGHPYMGVGRNMLVSKNAFLSIGGYQKHQSLAAGDDDLLIQEMASNNIPVNICIEAGAWVFSDAPNDLTSYFRQKNRHIGVSKSYTIKFKILLGIFAVMQILFWLLAIALILFFPKSLDLTLIVIVTKWLFQSFFHYSWFMNLGGKKCLLIFPLLDIMTPLYYLTVTINSSRKVNWK